MTTSKNQSNNPFLLQVKEDQRSYSVKSTPAALLSSAHKSGGLSNQRKAGADRDESMLNYSESGTSSNLVRATNAAEMNMIYA